MRDWAKRAGHSQATSHILKILKAHKQIAELYIAFAHNDLDPRSPCFKCNTKRGIEAWKSSVSRVATRQRGCTNKTGKKSWEAVSFNTTICKTKKINKGDLHDESHNGRHLRKVFFYSTLSQSRTKKVPYIRLL